MNVRPGDEVFVLNGTAYNFELAAGGALGFSSDSPFAPKSTSGERSYADYDPFSAVAFTDLSGGMGQERATDVTKYYDASNVDARGGRLILGPLVHYNSATLPGLDTHSDALLQGTNTTGTLDYLGIGASLPKVATKLIIPTGFAEIDRFWLPLKGYALAGTITIKVYNDSSGAPGTEMATTTLSRDELQPFGAWAQASFTPAVAVSAGGTYWISVEHAGADSVLYWYGGTSDVPAYSSNDNCVSWVDGAWAANTGTYWHLIVMYDDPTTRPDSSLRYVLGAGEDGITRLWGYSGRRLYYIGAASLPVAVQDGAGNSFEAAAEILHAVWFRAVADAHPYLYCALGDATSYVKFDGNIGTEQWATITMTGSGVSQGARRLAVHDNLLWRADEVCNVSASLDGTAYGGTVAVGDKTYPIRNMLSWNGLLYVGKDDGLYSVTYAAGYPTSGAPTVTKVLDFGAMASSVNFAAMCEHQGDLVFSLERGLIRFTGGNVVTPISPDTGLNLSADQRAVYRSAHSSLNVLWVCAEGSLTGKSSLMALIDWHWHPIVTLPRAGDMMRSVHVEPGLYAQYPRVWFKAGLQVAYVNMPTTTQKRWLWGTDMDYVATGTIDLPWIDGNIRTINKDWVQVEIDARNCDVDRPGTPPAYGNRVEIYYRTEEDAAWTLLGHVHAAGISTVAFPASTYGGKVQLRIGLWTADGANPLSPPPQVEAVVLKYMERPADAVAFTRTYILKGRSPNRAGSTGVKSLAQWVTILQTLRESAEPLTFYPFWGVDAGVSYNVHIANYAVSEVRSEVGVSAAASMIATLKLNQVK
jgi:hypothetical protein